MADEHTQIPPQLTVDARWDACYDITLRRFFYSSLVGAASGLLFFRSPVTRWASLAFGAGIGLGSAYTDCSRIMAGALPMWPLPSTVSQTSSSSTSKEPHARSEGRIEPVRVQTSSEKNSQ